MIAERNYKKLEKQQEILLRRSNYVLEKKNRMRFLKLDLKWSIECQFCYCLHLNCTVKEERRQCCNFGEMINNPDKSKFCLKPLSDKYWKLLLDNSNHFKTNDILYNNKFRLSFTGNLIFVLIIIIFICINFYYFCIIYSCENLWIIR